MKLFTMSWVSSLIYHFIYFYCWIEIKIKKILSILFIPTTTDICLATDITTDICLATDIIYINNEEYNRIFNHDKSLVRVLKTSLPPPNKLIPVPPFLKINLDDELTKQTQDITQELKPYFVVGNTINKDLLEFITGKEWTISTLIIFIDAEVVEHEIHITNTIQFIDNGYVIYPDVTPPPLFINLPQEEEEQKQSEPQEPQEPQDPEDPEEQKQSEPEESEEQKQSEPEQEQEPEESMEDDVDSTTCILPIKDLNDSWETESKTSTIDKEKKD